MQQRICNPPLIRVCSRQGVWQLSKKLHRLYSQVGATVRGGARIPAGRRQQGLSRRLTLREPIVRVNPIGFPGLLRVGKQDGGIDLESDDPSIPPEIPAPRYTVRRHDFRSSRPSPNPPRCPSARWQERRAEFKQCGMTTTSVPLPVGRLSPAWTVGPRTCRSGRVEARADFHPAIGPIARVQELGLGLDAAAGASKRAAMARGGERFPGKCRYCRWLPLRDVRPGRPAGKTRSAAEAGVSPRQ